MCIYIYIHIWAAKGRRRAALAERGALRAVLAADRDGRALTGEASSSRMQVQVHAGRDKTRVLIEGGAFCFSVLIHFDTI